MSELQRLKSLLPPENESWVFIEAAAAIDPPLITLEKLVVTVEIQIDLDEWDNFAIDHEIYYFGMKLEKFKMIRYLETDGKWLLLHRAWGSNR